MDPTSATYGFLSNAAANLVGTLVGAGLAVWTAYIANSRSDRQRDRRLLQSLIDRLHWTRALRPNQVGGRGGSQRDAVDRDRCTRSIRKLRERIHVVRDGLSGRTAETPELDAMLLACLGYLRRETREPDDYVALLMRLRAALAREMDALCDKDQTLRRQVIGAGDEANLLD